MKPIAICIGHSRLIDGHPEGGALMLTGESEWTYNSRLGADVVNILAAQRYPAILIKRYEGTGYGNAQRWLANHLAELDVQCAVELHFNSSDNPDAHGHEWLFWHTSTQGRSLATELEAEFCLCVPQIKTRGIKPKTSADRGAEFLRGTPCPAVIAETFFGSNVGDCKTATAKQLSIARAIAEGIISWID